MNCLHILSDVVKLGENPVPVTLEAKFQYYLLLSLEPLHKEPKGNPKGSTFTGTEHIKGMHTTGRFLTTE